MFRASKGARFRHAACVDAWRFEGETHHVGSWAVMSGFRVDSEARLSLQKTCYKKRLSTMSRILR